MKAAATQRAFAGSSKDQYPGYEVDAVIDVC